MAISEAEVKHVAALSKLEISDEEISMFTEQLGDIIDMVEYLDEVDTTGVPVTVNVVHNETVLRPDTVAQDNTREELLRNVPDKENGYIRVPVIIEDGGAGA